MPNIYDIRQLFCAALTGLLACSNSSNDDAAKIAAQAMKQAEAAAALLEQKYPYPELPTAASSAAEPEK